MDKIDIDSRFDEKRINEVRIKNKDTVEQIINNFFISKKELNIIVYPSKDYFKTYLLEINSKYLLLDGLMPFYGNKLMPKSSFVKVGIGQDTEKFERYFITKYKEELINKENDINFLIFKPIEVVTIEKRTVLRVSANLSNTAFISFSIKSENYFLPVYDISWNGISFNSDFKIESDYIIKKALIRLADKFVNADLRVAHSTYVANNYRIGCSIMEMNSNDRDTLINFMLTIERQNINSGLV